VFAGSPVIISQNVILEKSLFSHVLKFFFVLIPVEIPMKILSLEKITFFFGITHPFLGLLRHF